MTMHACMNVGNAHRLVVSLYFNESVAIGRPIYLNPEREAIIPHKIHFTIHSLHKHIYIHTLRNIFSIPHA